MTNSIRLVVVASPLGNGEAQVTPGSPKGMRPKGRAGKLRVETRPGPGGDNKWLEAERLEGLIREARRPERKTSAAFIAPDKDTKNRPLRSQSIRSSDEAG